MEEKDNVRASLRRLKFCNFKLKSLLDVTRAINSNYSTIELLNSYENLLRKELNIGKLVIYSFNKKWEKILESGPMVPRNMSIDVDKYLQPYTEITTTLSIQNEYLQHFDIIVPVFHNRKALAYVLVGDIDEEMEGMSPTIKHLRFIQTLTNIIIVAIENKRLYKENIRQEAVRKELELAARMQAMLIPDLSSFQHSSISVSAFYLPHFEVGGDYYDFFELSTKEYAFCIADVAGKGISAALLMSNFQANLRALFTTDISLIDLVMRLNERVIANSKGETFITLFVGKYNVENKELRYINAGHTPPILYDKSNNDIVYLTSGSPGIGMLDDVPFVNEGMRIITSGSLGTKLICYTDGLVELGETVNIKTGMKAIEKLLCNDSSIEATIDNIREVLEINRDNNLFFDDVSILGFEFY